MSSFRCERPERNQKAVNNRNRKMVRGTGLLPKNCRLERKGRKTFITEKEIHEPNLITIGFDEHGIEIRRTLNDIRRLKQIQKKGIIQKRRMEAILEAHNN